MKNKANTAISNRQVPQSNDEEKRRNYFETYLLFLDGLAFYADAECPKEERQKHIKMGWGIGKQIISQYVIEMLIRIRLEQQGKKRKINTHNLAYLYRMLPKTDQQEVEDIYKRMLNSEVEWTWDIFQTVDSFLTFLGKNPIKQTRYPWQVNHRGTLFSPSSYRALTYAFFVGLHGYPVAAGSLDKRFDTEFRSFEESRRNRYDSKGNRI